MFVFVSFFCLWCISFVFFYSLFFFFNDTATTEIYTSDTLFPYTTLFRSPLRQQRDHRPAHAAVPAARGARRGADPVGGLRARCHRGAPEHRSDRGAPRRQRNPRRPAQRRLRVQRGRRRDPRSEEHTSELQSLMRISYAVFCLKKKKQSHK